MNKYYEYKNSELWYNETWERNINPIDGLFKWIWANKELNPAKYHLPIPENPAADPNYKKKTLSIEDPQFMKYWADKGIRVSIKSMGMKRWMSMVPEKVFAEPEKRLPALLVLHTERYDDPWWPNKTVEFYSEYNELLARKQDFFIVYIMTEGDDKVRQYFNIMQEAFVLYPTDFDKMYVDVSVPLEKGQKLSQIPNFIYKNKDGVVENPDEKIEYFSDLSIPVLSFSGRWNCIESLGRGLIMSYPFNEGLIDREKLIHSQSGKIMMKGIALEYQYETVDDPGLISYWESMGLKYTLHYSRGERWITLVPRQSLEEPDKKIPVVCIMQEVYHGNEHLAVTAYSYLYEYTEIAAQGECMLLFFVLEHPDQNDLLEEILNSAAELYPIDPSRIYITGHSHDASFSREFARRHSDIIAALALLGHDIGMMSPEEFGEPILGITDEMVETFRTMDMPTIIMNGHSERRSILPTDEAEKIKWAKRWQRRLRAYNCPMKSVEEILAAFESEDYVTRMVGVPCDRTDIIWLYGMEHYIADIYNDSGKCRLRIILEENMPHVVTPGMLDLSWSWIKRFARDRNTGETIELFK